MENNENRELRHDIGLRLRLFRESLGLNQTDFAKVACGTKRAIQDNEAGNTAPNSKALHGLIGMGLNANWLITGNGQMKLRDFEVAGYIKSNLDQALLRFVIEVINNALQKRECTLDAYKYAEIAAIFYDYCNETQRLEATMADRLIGIACSTTDKKGISK